MKPQTVPQPEARERVAWSARIAARLAQGADDGPEAPEVPGRLAELTALFGLTPFERDAIALLWVLAFAPEQRPLWTGNENGLLTPLRVAVLFGHRQRVRLASEGAALLWQLLSEQPLFDGGAALALDPAILAWLEGEHELDRSLVGRVRMATAQVVLPSWPVAHTAAAVREGLAEGCRWRLVLATDDAMAALQFALAVGRELALPVMVVETGSLSWTEGESLAVRLQRQAFLDRIAPFLSEADAALALPPEIVPFPLQFVVTATQPAALAGVRDWRIPLPPPDAEERRQLWRLVLPEVASWPPPELDHLAARSDLPLAHLLSVAATAPADAATAIRRLRALARDPANGLAQSLESAFTWEDLVVPSPVRERLLDIAFEARERSRLWAEPEARRLYPQGRGLVALFAGPPGTGKTMAAQVIAADLGLTLLRVDLSAVLSKWVGETAQHLQTILAAESSRRSVLFFDEADALYGKRVENVRDAQDRFANMDVSHLMVALEGYDGIVLLATNLKANIDPAFIRRIRHLVDFPKPDETARLEIWTRTITALFGADEAARLGPAVQKIAAIAATGAQIKNAALSAAFATRRHNTPADARLLARILSRELAKDGTGLSERDLDALVEERP